MQRVYWSWEKSRYLTWKEYKRFCVPKYMKKEYGALLQQRIESLYNNMYVTRNKKEIRFG